MNIFSKIISYFLFATILLTAAAFVAVGMYAMTYRTFEMTAIGISLFIAGVAAIIGYIRYGFQEITPDSLGLTVYTAAGPQFFPVLSRKQASLFFDENGRLLRGTEEPARQYVSIFNDPDE